MLKVWAVSSMVIAVAIGGAAHAQSTPVDDGVAIVLETPEPSAVNAPGKSEDDTTYLSAPAQDGDDNAVTDTGTTVTVSSPRQAVDQPSTPTVPSLSAGGATSSGVGTAVGGIALDSGTLQRIVERMIQYGLLSSSADAQDPTIFDQAVRGYQRLIGIAETGILDRDTVGRFLAP
jgi:hypothetical protein